MLSKASNALASLKQGVPLCADKAIFEIMDSGDWLYEGASYRLSLVSSLPVF